MTEAPNTSRATRIAALVPVALFALLGVALFFGLKRDPATLPSVLIGKPFPAFALGPVRAGDQGFSSADIKGKVVLINVWGSWCVACRVEHPYLVELHGRGVPIYGVDWKDDPAKGAQVLLSAGDPYLKVGDDSAGRLALDLGVTGAPETFVVDKKGQIRFKQIGPITEEVWSTTLAPLIHKLEVEP
jgi:cytochrome c biogenesis protein CcmG/thiol:disulfide interchange protein DsbE